MNMNLYKLTQTENDDRDASHFAVVAAPDVDTARTVIKFSDWWAPGPEYVTVELIGTAISGFPSGIIVEG